MPDTAGPVYFTDEALAHISRVVPLAAPPERVALLPEILQVWAKEDLRGHLSRETRTASRKREKQLRSIGVLARQLLKAMGALDRHGCAKMLLKPHMDSAGTNPWAIDMTAAEQQRDYALEWLRDVAKTFNALETSSHPKGQRPPHKRTRHYLIMCDLAAIFGLVSGEQATRRVDFDTNTTYGPFWEFAKSVWLVIFENNRGLSYAMRVWAEEMGRQQKLADAAVHEATCVLSRNLFDWERDAIELRVREHSNFAHNIQFRHPALWRKLRTSQ
jgi:hypothetical protein